MHPFPRWSIVRTPNVVDASQHLGARQLRDGASFLLPTKTLANMRALVKLFACIYESRCIHTRGKKSWSLSGPVPVSSVLGSPTHLLRRISSVFPLISTRVLKLSVTYSCRSLTPPSRTHPALPCTLHILNTKQIVWLLL